MAVVSGTLVNVDQVKSDANDPLQFIALYFTVSGTYAQADNGILSGVPTLIQNGRRNGKTVTMKTVSLWQPARKASDPALLMGLKTLAISSSDITFEITENATGGVVDVSTEAADATAVPTQSTPFGILVGYVES